MKILRIILATSLALALSACGHDEDDEQVSGSSGSGSTVVNSPNASTPAVNRGGGCEVPSNLRSQMLQAVNAWRARGATCGSQYYPPTHSVSWDSRLESAAQRHANDMANNNFFSHTGSDRSTAQQRVEATGYNWRAYGENLYASTTGTVSEAVQSWLDSVSHCEILMSSHYTEMGVACSYNPDSYYGVYYVQKLGEEF